MAVLAGFGVFVLGSTLSRGSGPGGPTVKVVAAARDIPFRGVLGPDDLTLRDVSSSDVPTLSYSHTKDAEKLVSSIDIKQGQVITQNMLTKQGDVITGQQLGYLDIPSGYVAIAVPTSEQQGVAGFPQAGDYLTVITTVQGSVVDSNNTKIASLNSTKTVFTQLRILRVGQASNQIQPASGGGQQQQQATGVTSVLTVLMTQCDAEYMTWFLSNASIKYTLEANRDYQKVDKQGLQPDPNCPNILAAHGVSSKQVQARFQFPF
jgi:Flp pilus assembly protein CpaB